MKTFDTHAFLAVLFPILLLGSCASLKQKEYAVPSFSDLSSGVFRKDIEEGRALEVLQTIQFLRQEASAEETAELDDLYSEALLAAESDFYRAAGENDFRKAISVFSSFITLGVDDRLEGWTLEELRLSFVRYEIDQKRIVPGLLLLEDWFPELEGIITSDELGSFAKYAYEEKQVKLLASLAEAMRTRGLSTPPEYSAQAEGAFPGPDTQKGTVTILVNRGIKLEGGMGYPDQVIGSGFFIDRSGYILTNYHVISSEVDPEYEGFSRLYVRLHSSAKDRIPAKVVGYDRIFDIALLKIEIESPYVFGFTDTKQVNPGDRIFAIGSPGGLENTITSGIVSATGRRFLQMGDTIQVDVPINPGNSGGPLLNDAGELIGLVFAGIEQFEGVNFAIPSYWFRRLIPDLYLGSELVHSWFGLAVNEDNKKLTTMYVLPGGPAFKAGLKRDDIITAVNGKQTTSLAEIHDILLSLEPSTLVTLTFQRDGKSVTRIVSLGKRPYRPLDVALERDVKENIYVPLFGFTLEQTGESVLSRSYLVKEIYKGSIADETGISINDPLNVQRWYVDKKTRIAALQIFIKKRKAGFMETAIQLAAYLEIDYFI